MTLIEKINFEIKEAIRAQNKVRLETLRMLKSKILAADARASLPDGEVVKLFKTYYGNLQEAKEGAANRPDMIQKLEKEMAIVQEFLPTALSPEETKKVVMQAITASGAKTKKDIGAVMKAVRSLNSAVDGKLAKEIADKLLEG